MLNPFHDVTWNPGPAELRSFARSLIVGFPCLALLLLVIGHLTGKGWNVSFALELGGIGAATGGAFLFAPSVARPFYVLWYFLGCCVGFVVGNLLLVLVFYVFVTSLGLVMRARRQRPIRKTKDTRVTTYWREAEQPSDLRRYYHQY